MEKYIRVPLQDEEIKVLEAGDYVYISGTVYTARDAAHKRMYEAMNENENIPLNLEHNVIYYMDRLRPERDIPSVQPDRRRAAVWTSMRRCLWTMV